MPELRAIPHASSGDASTKEGRGVCGEGETRDTQSESAFVIVLTRGCYKMSDIKDRLLDFSV